MAGIVLLCFVRKEERGRKVCDGYTYSRYLWQKVGQVVLLDTICHGSKVISS